MSYLKGAFGVDDTKTLENVSQSCMKNICNLEPGIYDIKMAQKLHQNGGKRYYFSVLGTKYVPFGLKLGKIKCWYSYRFCLVRTLAVRY